MGVTEKREIYVVEVDQKHCVGIAREAYALQKNNGLMIPFHGLHFSSQIRFNLKNYYH